VGWKGELWGNSRKRSYVGELLGRITKVYLGTIMISSPGKFYRGKWTEQTGMTSTPGECELVRAHRAMDSGEEIGRVGK
jgi:hypothetical protein